MPYKDAIKAREHARMRQITYRQRHPERLKEHRKQQRQKHQPRITAYMEEYRLKNAEKLRQQNLDYKAAHRAEQRATAKAYNAAHQAQLKAARKLRYDTNKEEELTRSIAYYHANTERINAQRRQSFPKRKARVNGKRQLYRASNPELHRAIRQRRRARKLGAPRNDFTTEQRIMVMTTAHGVCAYCPYYNPTCEACLSGTHALHIEHITPLTKNGPNTLWNIVAACGSCNSRKHDKPAPGLVQPWLL